MLKNIQPKFKSLVSFSPLRSLSTTTPASEKVYEVQQKAEDWKSCVAIKPITKGQVIDKFGGDVLNAPNRFTIQIQRSAHVMIYGGPEYTNHSCDPNTHVMVDEINNTITYVAIKDIKQGDDITFNYNTTEWDMDEKFECKCGSKNCTHGKGLVAGAKYLNADEMLRLLDLFTPDIARSILRDRLEQEDTTTRSDLVA